MLLVVSFVLALAIGVVLGMLGGGGSILMLPVLVYVLGVASKDAIAMSLAVIGATSAFAMWVYARSGAVRWRIGALFGAGAMAGAYAGGRLAKLVPAGVLLLLFGLLMIAASAAMLRRRRAQPAQPRPLRVTRILLLLLLGACVGVLSGLVGAGGGFLIVPALSVWGGLPTREAIGTSLLVIALQSCAGFAGHISHAHLSVQQTVVIAAAAVLGSVLGASKSASVPEHLLRRGFAWLVLSIGVFLCGKQVYLYL
jgi:uncharacterized protein